MLYELETNWMRLTEHSVFERVTAQLVHEVFLDLVARYSEPHRFYHTVAHIDNLFTTIGTIRKFSDTVEPDYSTIITLAIWFHDVIYNTRASDNEEKSIEYAETVLTRLNVCRATLDRVKTLILATEKHHPPNEDLTCQIFLDADLAILSANSREYNQYAQAIRHEYAWIPLNEYRVGRKRVLESFLQRERLYFTAYMYTTKETAARINLKAESESLSL